MLKDILKFGGGIFLSCIAIFVYGMAITVVTYTFYNNIVLMVLLHLFLLLLLCTGVGIILAVANRQAIDPAEFLHRKGRL